MNTQPILIATRGSALALAQANQVLAQCRSAFPALQFAIKIIKTTGDKLQTAALAKSGELLPKGLFTKELEVALLEHRADLAVHSLKDLPTELPTGLKLGAVGLREDARDVIIYRDAARLQMRLAAPASNHERAPVPAKLSGFPAHYRLKDFPAGSIFATSSTRRQSHIQAARPDIKCIPIRGNVATRLQKLSTLAEFDATLLAWAGMRRLGFEIQPAGHLTGDGVPDGLYATRLELEEMLPCVGQAAVGIEIRTQDERLEAICARLNHHHTFQCVTAERAFLRAMGGGCQAPVAAYAEILGTELKLQAVSFRDGPEKRAELRGDMREAEFVGLRIADQLK